jgi:hypothetical protein
VDVVPVGEHPVVPVEPVDLAGGPVGVLPETALEGPIQGQERSGPVVAEQRLDGPAAIGTITCSQTQILERPGGHPTPAGEVPRADHAAGVEVVPFVPAVVVDLVPLVRVDECEQGAAESDLTAEVGVLRGRVVGCGGLLRRVAHRFTP